MEAAALLDEKHGITRPERAAPDERKGGCPASELHGGNLCF